MSQLEHEKHKWNEQIDGLVEGWNYPTVDWEVVRSEVIEVCRYVCQSSFMHGLTHSSRALVQDGREVSTSN